MHDVMAVADRIGNIPNAGGITISWRERDWQLAQGLI
jgi:hypothetical protein